MENAKLNYFDELEIEEYEDQPQEEKEKFKITDIDAANWAFRKITAYQKKKEELDRLAENEIKRITEWKEKETNQIDNSIGYFESLLTAYFLEQRQEDPRFKISTPYGKVSTRKQQPKWEYQDQEKVIAWLKERGQEKYIRVKEEIEKGEIKKDFNTVGHQVVDENGEIVEGIYILEREPKIIIKAGE